VANVIRLAIVLSLIMFPFSMSHASISVEKAGSIAHGTGKMLSASHSNAKAQSMEEQNSDFHNSGHDEQSCSSYCGAALLVAHPQNPILNPTQFFARWSAKSVDLGKWFPPYRPPNT